MTKIIILEGTGTSGKSIMQKKIKDYYISNQKTVQIINEYKTTKNLHFQKTRNKNESLNQLKKIIKSLNTKTDYIILDRFHFSHIASLDLQIEDFKEIEDSLKKLNTKIILFYYSSNSIIKRIRNSLQHRKGTNFETFFNNIIKNSNSIDEENKKIFQHFNQRTKKLKEIIKKTNLETLKINVSKINNIKDYDKLIPKIINFTKTKKF